MSSSSNKTAVAQSQVVQERNALQQEGYDAQKQLTKILLAMLSICAAVISFLVWLAFFHFPITTTVATSNAAAVCNIAPVSEPFIDDQTVANFAVDAATGIYTYDHANYQRQLTDAANRYFTPAFRDQFMVNFGNSDTLKAVRQNYYIVKATSSGRPPQIVRSGVRDGSYFWVVQVPLTVYYISGRNQQTDRLLDEVVVTRTPATRINPRGIAVSGMNINQLRE